jgi:hypothetical protein
VLPLTSGKKEHEKEKEHEEEIADLGATSATPTD